MKAKKSIDLIVEKSEDGHFWGRIEGYSDWMATGQGETIEDLIQEVKYAIEDYVEHEGKNHPFWSKVDLAAINFNLVYDLQAFFEEFDELKISKIAKAAGINESLMRHYANGSKYPSAKQVKKIETAIHDRARKLLEVSLTA